MAKKRTTITIEENLLEFARKLGLNISAFLEKRLEELHRIVQGARFELANPYGTGPSSLRLWPGSATPATMVNNENCIYIFVEFEGEHKKLFIA